MTFDVRKPLEKPKGTYFDLSGSDFSTELQNHYLISTDWCDPFTNIPLHTINIVVDYLYQS